MGKGRIVSILLCPAVSWYSINAGFTTPSGTNLD
jgi:hypothetical protein